jgi:hypothetical protein
MNHFIILEQVFQICEKVWSFWGGGFSSLPIHTFILYTFILFPKKKYRKETKKNNIKQLYTPFFKKKYSKIKNEKGPFLSPNYFYTLSILTLQVSSFIL